MGVSPCARTNHNIGYFCNHDVILLSLPTYLSLALFEARSEKLGDQGGA